MIKVPKGLHAQGLSAQGQQSPAIQLPHPAPTVVPPTIQSTVGSSASKSRIASINSAMIANILFLTNPAGIYYE